MRPSTRNQLTGTVTAVTPGSVVVLVESTEVMLAVQD